jgi:hypothetical protein
MEAQLRRPWIGVATLMVCCIAASTARAQFAQQRSVAHSPNFIVFADTPQLAQEMSQAAEQWRRDLAIHWLGREMPPWSARCPLHVTAAPNLGAGGETRFTLGGGAVGNWMMSVQGSRERILDSVLPHEITHTIFASHFAPMNKHVPRWADEGACTTVEHESEQAKHKVMLQQFLREGRGLTFNRMFSLKDYPRDILPLYAQGHAVVEFLIAQGGPRQFVKFLEAGMASGQWETAIQQTYGYETLGELKVKWNEWLVDGRGSVDQYVANSRAATRGATLAANTGRGIPGPTAGAAPGMLAVAKSAPGQSVAAEGPAVLLVSNDSRSGGAQVGPAVQAAGRVAPPAASQLLAAAHPAASAAPTPGMQSGKGWYKEQLERNTRTIQRPVSEPQPTALTGSAPALTGAPVAAQGHANPAHASANANANANPVTTGHNVARPQPMQSVQTSVIDWGTRYY